MRNILLITGLLILFTGCKSIPEKTTFKGFTPNENSWEEVFFNSSDIELEVWNTGRMELKYDGILNVKSPDAEEYKGKKKVLDIPVFYVKSGDYSYLIDTGVNKEYSESKLKYARGLVAPLVLADVEQESGEAVIDRLNKNSIELTHIFLTHMHFDHIAGLIDIKPDFPVVFGEKEEEVQFNLLFVTDYMKDVKDLREIDFNIGKELYPFKNVVDIFGDSSLFAINTGGGHSHGHTLYLVNGKDQKYLVAGDQVNVIENVETGVGPGSYSVGVDEAQESFDKIMEFIELNPQVKLLMGHDLREVN